MRRDLLQSKLSTNIFNGIQKFRNSFLSSSAQEVARFTSIYSATGSGVLLRFTNQLSSGTNPNPGEYNLAGIKVYDYASNWAGALALQTPASGTSGGGNLVDRVIIPPDGGIILTQAGSSNTAKITPYSPGAANPRVSFFGGTSSSDTNYGLLIADQYSAAGTQIPCSVYCSTDQTTTNTNAKQIGIYVTTTESTLFSINRDNAGNSPNPMYFVVGNYNSTSRNGIIINNDANNVVTIGSDTIQTSAQLNLIARSTLPGQWVTATGAEQQRLRYDASNYLTTTVNSTGSVTLDCTGTNPAIIVGKKLRLKGYTVATLPAGTIGDTAYVTDALAPTFLAVLVGGGAITTTCFYNGTNWVAQ